ncbi:hypothetical protein [Muricoccus pecuniae]|uniref:Uncharacterized protein n=1 Tax=Muricoccus pecuniae TaxID=693023 RepID=A0A840YII1_9PROT|nr:hypothetical protein [Roseomonas pecuniae]MBB5693734.1 hypothetical protein [Roseomonas pecuniae]
MDEEMRAAQPTPEQAEQLAPMIAMHARMAMEGEAEGSLRLLARVIAGQLEQDDLSPAEFASYARILSGMRHAEIIALGTFYRSWQEAEKADLGPKEDAVERTANMAYSGKMVPNVVPNYGELKALMSGLTRTGLLIEVPTVDGGNRYQPSSLFHRLSELASLESAAEPAATAQGKSAVD